MLKFKEWIKITEAKARPGDKDYISPNDGDNKPEPTPRKRSTSSQTARQHRSLDMVAQHGAGGKEIVDRTNDMIVRRT